jgi:hypothetical protein
MIGLLWRLLVGRFSSCSHEWKTMESRSVFMYPNDRPFAIDKECCCQKCGAWRRFRV